MSQRGKIKTKECPIGLATWRPLATPERVCLAGVETCRASSPTKYYFFCHLNEEMNSKGVNNFPKVTDLVRGAGLGFESRCIRSLESLRVNSTEAVVEGEHSFQSVALQTWKGPLRLWICLPHLTNEETEYLAKKV